MILEIVAKNPPPSLLKRTSHSQYHRCEMKEGKFKSSTSLPTCVNFFTNCLKYCQPLTPLHHTVAASISSTTPVSSQTGFHSASGDPDSTLASSTRTTSDRTARESQSNCIVCWEQPQDAVLLECGHGGLCVACADLLWRQTRRCPLCREGFAGVMRIVDASDASDNCMVRSRLSVLLHAFGAAALRSYPP